MHLHFAPSHGARTFEMCAKCRKVSEQWIKPKEEIPMYNSRTICNVCTEESVSKVVKSACAVKTPVWTMIPLSHNVRALVESLRKTAYLQSRLRRHKMRTSNYFVKIDRDPPVTTPSPQYLARSSFANTIDNSSSSYRLLKDFLGRPPRFAFGGDHLRWDTCFKTMSAVRHHPENGWTDCLREQRAGCKLLKQLRKG